MTRLKSKLLSLNTTKPANLETKVFSPANCEELRIPIRMDKTAKVVGKLAERIQISQRPFSLTPSDDEKDAKEGTERNDDDDSRIITGVLVQNDLKLSLMAPEDLREYAGLVTTTITCRQKLTLAAAGIELIRWALEGTFGGIADLSSIKNEGGPDAGVTDWKKLKDEDPADDEVDRSVHRFLVMDTVTVTYRNQGEMEVEWEGNMMNDGIADAVLAVLFSVESSPAAVKRESIPLLPGFPTQD